MKDGLKIFIGTACWLGLSPFIPGAFGALLGVIGHLLIVWLTPLLWWWPLLFLFFLATAVANHWLTPWAQQYWKSKDPRNFVLDEVAGYLVVPLVIYPLQAMGYMQGLVLWEIAGVGYVLFRIFDTVKIPPALQIDRRTHTAWGILADDLVSGLYAVIGVYVVHVFWTYRYFHG